MKIKKKVLIIANDNMGIGGIQNVIIGIIRELKTSFQFDVVVFNHHNTEYENEILEQGKIYTIPLYEGKSRFRKRLDFYVRPIYIYNNIKRIINKNGPYVAIHCHNYFEEALGILAAYNNGIQTRITHSHSYMPSSARQIARKMYERFYRHIITSYSTNNLACSSLAGEYLYGKSENITVIPNAIDVNRFRVKNKCNNPWSFLHVGRWGGPKNQLFLLDVFYEIYKANPISRLTLVGSGEECEEEKIKKAILNLKLESAVDLLPANSNIPEIMSRNNVFIFPSIFEGLGIVVIEAQASGMHCFASTNVPREADLGNIEFLDLSIGAKEWAKKISQYIHEYSMLRKEVDMASYDIHNVIKEYYKIYNGAGIR